MTKQPALEIDVTCEEGRETGQTSWQENTYKRKHIIRPLDNGNKCNFKRTTTADLRHFTF